eukprot:6474201-Amphidinium_carterae.1
MKLVGSIPCANNSSAKECPQSSLSPDTRSCAACARMHRRMPLAVCCPGRILAKTANRQLPRPDADVGLKVVCQQECLVFINRTSRARLAGSARLLRTSICICARDRRREALLAGVCAPGGELPTPGAYM